MRHWVPGVWMGLVLAGALLSAGDAAPLPPWQRASGEINHEKTFLKIYVNNFGTLWSEFSRSQLYKSFAQDPAVAANAAKFVDKIDARVKALNKVVKQDDDLYLLHQIEKIGPIAAGYAFNPNSRYGGPVTVVDFLHSCDAPFLNQLNRHLSLVGRQELLALFGEGYEFKDEPFAHRELKGHIVVPTSFGATFYSDSRHIVFAGMSQSEAALFKQFTQGAAALESEQDFAAFMGKKDSWLAAAYLDVPALVKNAPEEVREADIKAVAGALSRLSVKEQVNKANRFDTELTYPGADLNQAILFFGAGAPLNNEVAQIYPDELIFITHLNYDYRKLLRLDPKELAGTSDDFRKSIERMQKNAAREISPEPEAGQPAIPGPVMTHGVSMLMMESDKLEDLSGSFVFAFGIEKGFKVSETWAGALSVAKNWDGEKKPVKIVSYNNTDIAVIGDANSSQTCFAAVGGVLVMGNSLKQVKRVVRYLNRVQAGEVDPQKANEWTHLTTLVQQDGHGSLHGFMVLKMDYLLKTLLPTGIGAGAMLFPDLPTNVDWTAVAGRLQPATCVLMYDPAKGIKGRMVSDLPLPTLVSLAGVTGALGLMADRSYWGGGQNADEDLPPLRGQGGGGAGWGEAVPEEAPAVQEKQVEPDLAPAVPEGAAPAPQNNAPIEPRDQ